MQTIVVMCGFPRSGITTYTKTYLKDFYRISVDDLISMTAHNFEIKLGNFYTKVEKTMINELVATGYDVVIDKTALTKKSRKRIINKINQGISLGKLAKPFLKLIFLDTPAEISIDRNIKTQKVPPFIISQMIRSFEMPTLDEGWDEIIRIKGNITEIAVGE